MAEFGIFANKPVMAVLGLDHNFGQRRSVCTADPTIRPRFVGSAVRTNDLAAGAVVGIMTKAAVLPIRRDGTSPVPAPLPTPSCD